MPPRRQAISTKHEGSKTASPVNGKRRRSAEVIPAEETTARPRSRKQPGNEEENTAQSQAPSVKRGARANLPIREEAPVEDSNSDEDLPVETTKPEVSGRRKPGKKPKGTEDTEADIGEDEDTPVKSKRRRKTKEEKDAEMMPLAARTVGLKMYVGAHTSMAGGVENAVKNCVHIGGNAFACFLKSQRKWDNPALKDDNRDAFHKAMLEHKYDGMQHVVPHGSYLVNLANEDKDKMKQSYDTFVDDLHRCEALGIRYYNFHPGGAGQSSLSDALTRLANNLNRALSETKTVVPLLENMAGHGTLIGGRFSDLRDVIAQIKPEYKSRIGVCIDTCHTFAAGYDLRSPEAFRRTMDEFDETVGIKYLKALHLNDSKMPLNSHRDLHQNIGLGFLGLRAFHNVMNEPRFEGLPLILETPCEKPDPDDPKGKKTIEDKTVWAKEIKLLESLIGMESESEEFKRLETELSEKGKDEREKLGAQHERTSREKAEKERKKQEKEKLKLSGAPEKGQTSLKNMFTPKGNVNGAKKSNQKKGKRESSESGGDLREDES